MTNFARAAALRSTALATSLVLVAGLSAFAAAAAPKVPLPKPRPIARNVVPKTTPVATAAAQNAAPIALNAPVAPVLAPATRQHAALPPPPRRPVTPAAIAATSSTSQADIEALESVIELVRKHKSADATQVQAAISDPVAKKLAEWIILRSDNNGASVERYRAFIAANPSWPSQTFLRRRLEAALWDDRRDDAAAWSLFENELPMSAKGEFALAKAMIARGDRANAERLVREAWRAIRCRRIPRARRSTCSARCSRRATTRRGWISCSTAPSTRRQHARRQAARRRSRRARRRRASPPYEKAANTKALLDAVPRELHGDPGYRLRKIQLLRREEKFAEAAQLMLSAPKDPARLHNLDEWWIERRLLARKMIDVGEYRTAYLIARDAALPARDIYKTEQEFTAGWIALRFLNDPATAAQHFARIGVGSVNPTALARAGYWQGRAAEAAGRAQEARTAYARAAEQSTSYYGQLARAKLGLPQIELNGDPGRAGARRRAARDRPRGATALRSSTSAKSRSRSSAILGENGDPDALIGLGELTARYSDARGMLLLGKAALNRGLPFDFYAYPVIGHSVRTSRSGRKSSRASSTPSPGRKAPSTRPSSRRRRPMG